MHRLLINQANYSYEACHFFFFFFFFGTHTSPKRLINNVYSVCACGEMYWHHYFWWFLKGREFGCFPPASPRKHPAWLGRKQALVLRTKQFGREKNNTKYKVKCYCEAQVKLRFLIKIQWRHLSVNDGIACRADGMSDSIRLIYFPSFTFS